MLLEVHIPRGLNRRALPSKEHVKAQFSCFSWCPTLGPQKRLHEEGYQMGKRGEIAIRCRQGSNATTWVLLESRKDHLTWFFSRVEIKAFIIMHIYIYETVQWKKLVNVTDEWVSNFDGILIEFISNREKNAVFCPIQGLCSRFEIIWVSLLMWRRLIHTAG